MANSSLLGNEYGIPSNIVELLKQKDNAGEGQKRINELISGGKATYEQLKRFKHDIENKYQGDWSEILNWINSVLSTERNGVKYGNKVQMDVGAQNKFRSEHNKDNNGIEATKVVRISESQLLKLIENKINKLKTK